MNTPTRRQTLQAGTALLAATWLGLVTTTARSTAATLPVPRSLQAAGQTAGQRKEPLVLLMSLPGCPYCELVRRNYLLPMRADGLQAYEIDVTSRSAIADFAGQPSTGVALAARWKVQVTPTVLLVNNRGDEITDRLVGVSSVDFYGAYLDEALSRARQRLS